MLLFYWLHSRPGQIKHFCKPIDLFGVPFFSSYFFLSFLNLTLKRIKFDIRVSFLRSAPQWLWLLRVFATLSLFYFFGMTFALCSKLGKLILATGADTFRKLQSHRILISVQLLKLRTKCPAWQGIYINNSRLNRPLNTFDFCRPMCDNPKVFQVESLRYTHLWDTFMWKD